MRVAVTGTPGTGKTTVTELVDTDLDVLHLNDLVREAGLHDGRDDERGSLVADLAAIEAHLSDRDGVLIESHLAHHLPVDRVVVLRCHPRVLRERLLARDEHPEPVAETTGTDSGIAHRRAASGPGEDAGESGALTRSARENAEAEALDVVLSEAVECHGLENVYEIETTDRPPAAVAADVEAVLAGERDPSAGDVDYMDYIDYR